MPDIEFSRCIAKIYVRSLSELPDKKKEHILNGSTKLGHYHSWEDVTQHRTWDEVKEVILDVMEHGEENDQGKSGIASEKTLNVNGHDVQVRYRRMPDGSIKIGDAVVY